MSADTVCRVCLVTNLNLYGVRNELQDIYEIITRREYNKVGYPLSMCYICLSVLRKCHRFMETARDADRLLTQWYKHQNELVVVKPLNTYSITEATLLSVGNAHISLKHEFKTENIDVAEQLVVDVQIENTECNDNMDTEKSEVDETTDYSTMLVDTSTVTTYNDTTQDSDDKQTIPLFSTNMDNEWSRLDMVSQHYNDDSQICQITKVKSESETNEVIQLLSAHEIPKDLLTEIEIDETDDGDADGVCHTENLNMKLNPKFKILKTKNTQNRKKKNITDVCNKSCGSVAGLKRHGIHSTTKKLKKLNQKNKKISCSVCSYKCTQPLHLAMRTHTGEKPFSCDKCNYKCARKLTLIKHNMRTHTGVKPFSCDICNYKCAVKSRLIAHKRTHTREKPFSCDICNYKCARKSDLTRHIRTHTGEKPFSCDICNYRCTQKSSLTFHIRTHTGEKPFSCDICDYKCIQKSHLTQHIITHTGEKPFCCDTCNYKCTLKSALIKHMRTHTGEKAFSCDICNYKSTLKSTLIQHIRTHTGEKPFSCDICDYKCTQKSNLRKHMRTHTGEKPFSCDICNYKCAVKSSLTSHKRTHTGEMPFSCYVCDYKCTRKQHLADHMKTHSGEKPFSCDICHYKCAHKSSLRRHLITKHTGVKPFS